MAEATLDAESPQSAVVLRRELITSAARWERRALRVAAQAWGRSMWVLRASKQ